MDKICLFIANQSLILNNSCTDIQRHYGNLCVWSLRQEFFKEVKLVLDQCCITYHPNYLISVYLH